MKAVIYDRYGPPEDMRLAEVKKPQPTADQLLINIFAVSINGSDKEKLVGRPLYARIDGLRRPGNPILGSDIAGRVEAVGKNITEFKPGDAVFGELPGYHRGFAEYAVTHGRTLAHKPEALSFEQAAAIPQAGVLAWRSIREKGQVQAGQKVLINGAGGSAGSFAIQLAKMAGAEVTGVDNAHKQAFMRSLGADHTIDYTRENFTRGGRRYDLILDLIAHQSIFAYQRALAPGGTYFFVGGSVGVIFQLLFLAPLLNRMTAKHVKLLAVPQNREDLLAITDLCTSGAITPIIDRRYGSLADVPAAMRYVVAGQAKGKVVIQVTIEEDDVAVGDGEPVVEKTADEERNRYGIKDRK